MTNSITKINGREILTVEQDGEVFVPIKPICAALGIDDKRQREKIQDDEILASVGGLTPSTGADGKTYEMFCLPLRYVYGWLFTVNPKNVAPEAREKVALYRRECYDALYDHFFGKIQRIEDANDQERRLMQEIIDATATEKESREHRKDLERQLDQLRRERLNPQPQLF